MTWPRHRSAWSELTPALDIKERAVRRRSCNAQPLVPVAASNFRFAFVVPGVGFLPLGPLNTNALRSLRGVSMTATAAPESGRARGCLVLFLAAGNSHTPSLISFHVRWRASFRLAPVNNKKRTRAANGLSAFVFHIF